MIIIINEFSINIILIIREKENIETNISQEESDCVVFFLV